MNVLVDTSIWSLALRRQRHAPQPWQQAVTQDLSDLIGDGRAAIIGPVRQELLSGIAQPKQFASLLQSLRAFPDIAIRTDDWEHAARIANACRSSGIAGSTVDFLLCAVAIGNDMELFTADRPGGSGIRP